MRETWLSENQRLVSADNFGFDLAAVEAAAKKHEAIETDIFAYEERVTAVNQVYYTVLSIYLSIYCICVSCGCIVFTYNLFTLTSPETLNSSSKVIGGQSLCLFKSSFAY